jgi:hypothetical protein
MHVILVKNDSNTLILVFLTLYLAFEFSFKFQNVTLILQIYIYPFLPQKRVYDKGSSNHTHLLFLNFILGPLLNW